MSVGKIPASGLTAIVFVCYSVFTGSQYVRLFSAEEVFNKKVLPRNSDLLNDGLTLKCAQEVDVQVLVGRLGEHVFEGECGDHIKIQPIHKLQYYTGMHKFIASFLYSSHHEPE